MNIQKEIKEIIQGLDIETPEYIVNNGNFILRFPEDQDLQDVLDKLDQAWSEEIREENVFFCIDNNTDISVNIFR